MRQTVNVRTLTMCHPQSHYAFLSTLHRDNCQHVNKELNSYEGIPSTSLADKFEIEGE